jgi:hypothetical protein
VRRVGKKLPNRYRDPGASFVHQRFRVDSARESFFFHRPHLGRAHEW